MSLWTKISEKEEKALRIEMSKTHWKLKVDKIKYKQSKTQVASIHMYGFLLEDAAAVSMEDAVYVYIGNSIESVRRHNDETRTSLVQFEAANPKAKKFKTELFYVESNENNKVRGEKNNADRPQKIGNDAARLAEGKFIVAFLPVQLNKWSFKNFSPPCPATVKKDKYWPDLKFGHESLDKSIHLINRYIGSNYSKSELDELCHIAKVLFQADMKFHYEWEMDSLKY